MWGGLGFLFFFFGSVAGGVGWGDVFWFVGCIPRYKTFYKKQASPRLYSNNMSCLHYLNLFVDIIAQQ